jgi:hypothetical protein
MGHNFGSLVFTPVVRVLQERYGSRRQYTSAVAQVVRRLPQVLFGAEREDRTVRPPSSAQSCNTTMVVSRLQPFVAAKNHSIW